MPRDHATSPLDQVPWVPTLEGGFDVAIELGDEPVLRLRGDLDLAGVGQLEATAFRLLESGTRRVVLDLSDLDFLDVSGVNALLGLDRAARRAGGQLVLRRPSRQAAGVLAATRAAAALDVETV